MTIESGPPDVFANFSLAGRVVLVTGASRGIGRGLVDALVDAGATVAAGVRDDESFAELAGVGPKVRPYRLDVTETEEIQLTVDQVVNDLGGLDVLIANAGLGDNHRAVDVTEADWDQMMDVNAKGLFFTCQAAGRHMITQGRGRVIALSSQASVVGIVDHAVYCATKGAVNQIVRVLALEWGPLGVMVNAIAPTFTYTPGTAERLDDPEYRANVVARIPAGEVATIADIAGAAIYLASDAGRLVNGTTLVVDGGWTAQ